MLLNNLITTQMKFIILCQARTGSSMLCEMLNSHSLVQCDGELFNPITLQKKWGKMGLIIARKFPRFIVWYNYRKRKKIHYMTNDMDELTTCNGGPCEG